MEKKVDILLILCLKLLQVKKAISYHPWKSADSVCENGLGVGKVYNPRFGKFDPENHCIGPRWWMRPVSCSIICERSIPVEQSVLSDSPKSN